MAMSPAGSVAAVTQCRVRPEVKELITGTIFVAAGLFFRLDAFEPWC